MIKLQEIIPDDEDLVIISDRHQSIRNAVADVNKKSQHGFCAWHIFQNIKSRINRGSRAKTTKGMSKVKVKDAIIMKFMQVAAAYTVQEFNKQYGEQKNRYQIVAEDLEDNVDVNKWARCYFTGLQYNILTTNDAESINSVLKKIRTCPILPLINAIVNKISKWFNKHRNESSLGSLSQLLTLVVEKALHARHKESTILKVQELNRTAFEYFVKESNGSCLVDLGRGTCTCKVFDIDKFPYIHALAAYQEGPNKIHNLCSKYDMKELWSLAYVQTIYPVLDQSKWDILENEQNMRVLSPNVTTKRGRIQQTRFPSLGEHRRGTNKRSRKAMIADLGRFTRFVVFTGFTN